MERFGVAVLGVLNQEHHQEGYNCRRGIDDKLPSIGKVAKGTEGGPGENGSECD
jgi:hypothetical protein